MAMPWGRFYTRSQYWDLSSAKRDARGRRRLSHQAIRDLLKWRELSRNELSGRCMVPPNPDASMHTDAAGLGYDGTLELENIAAGIDGAWKAQGIWSWKDRVSSISLRELKAVRKLLCSRLGTKLTLSQKRNLLVYVDNQAVVHIANSVVSSSRPMMWGLRRLKLVLDKLAIQIRAEWIPSVANRFADALSRRFPGGDLQIRKQLMRSVQDGMRAPIDTFRYRPLDEHPVFRRRQAYPELGTLWQENGRRSIVVPPSGPNSGNGGEAERFQSTSDPTHTEMASTTLIPRSTTDGGSCEPTTTSAIRHLGVAMDVECRMASPCPGGQPVTRSATRMHIASVGSDRVRAVAGQSKLASRALQLVSDFAWSPCTAQSRNSQR